MICQSRGFPACWDVQAITWWVPGSKYMVQVMSSLWLVNWRAMAGRPTGSCASSLLVTPSTPAATWNRAARRSGAVFGYSAACSRVVPRQRWGSFVVAPFVEFEMMNPYPIQVA
jgi:hypothetical protein